MNSVIYGLPCPTVSLSEADFELGEYNLDMIAALDLSYSGVQYFNETGFNETAHFSDSSTIEICLSDFISLSGASVAGVFNVASSRSNSFGIRLVAVLVLALV